MSPATRRPGVRPSQHRRWPTLLVVLLLVVPLLEIVVIIAVGRTIGGWPTFALLLLESALGAWLVRREGSRTWHALTQALHTGRMPSRELSDAALVLVGGTLLLAPGFLTDVVGFVLILPVTRPVARRLLEAVIARRLLGGAIPGAFLRGAGAERPSAERPSVERPQDARSGGPDDVIEGEIL